MKKNQSFILAILMLIISPLLHAIPAIPTPIIFIQPDGKTLTVMIRGDERIHWYKTKDDYTLMYNTKGYLTYSQLDENDNMQPSEFIATDIEERDLKINTFLNTIDKNIFYSDYQIQIMQQIWQIEDVNKQPIMSITDKGVTGNAKGLCALVQFPEKDFIKTIEDFDPLFNQLGYTENKTGSVRDYFNEVSYKKLDFTITVCGIYTAPKSEEYYAGNGGHDRCSELARWIAQQMAADPNLDFSKYDSNNNGKVDAFHFIFAGRGQEGGGGKTTIWSHKGYFSPAVIKNGKRIDEYSCSPELRSSTAITTIGVICHEMTHGFGAADFYDTNYATGGEYTGTGNWDLMASGSWNGVPSGNCPAHPNMFIKIQFGWVNPIILNSPKTIKNMPNSAEYPIAYKINAITNNEYFLLENRQKIKFNTNNPGAGLLIYHVHSQVNMAGNCINCTHPQRMYPISANAPVDIPNSTPSSYGNINSTSCPFPGSSFKTSFTDETIPSMKAWNATNTNKPITNISNENNLVDFDFMGGSSNITYYIISTTTAGGNIEPKGEIEINENENKTFTIKPNSGFQIVDVLVDTESKGAIEEYKFENVSANHSIHVIFGNVGINDIKENYSSLKIIPNPAHDIIELQVASNKLQITNIEFYNTFGQMVKSVLCNGEINNNVLKQLISIKDLNKGIYFIKAGTETAKLVVH